MRVLGARLVQLPSRRTPGMPATRKVFLTMKRTTIAQLNANPAAFADKDVVVCGWTRSVRDMKNFGFVTLNDGSCFADLQVVMNVGLYNSQFERSA